ncbi:EAL domain-containing protein [Deinococcus sonorensis]|uniref:EAL domain-containing protein n=2 Tax=Deinococcus sonorensis TaxID=309891 RepID=A0AAU7U7C7_9DEIO
MMNAGQPGGFSSRLTAPERLLALARHDLPSRTADPALDTLVALAARALQVPVVAVNIVDAQRQVTLAVSSGDAGHVSVRHSFCARVVERGSLSVAADTRVHPDFCDLPLARSGAVVAYAAVPLRTLDGQVLGTLCAVDRRPRTFSPSELQDLEAFAHLAESLLSQRLALKTVRHEREQLRALIEAIPLATYAVDDAGAVCVWNRAAEHLYGHLAAQVLGQAPPELQVDGPPPAPVPQGGQLQGVGEARRVTRQGRIMDVRYHRATLRDVDGRVTLTVDTAADVTDRKHAQAQLEQQARVLEDMSEAVISCDEHFRLRTWNPAAARLYGWQREELEGRDLRELIPTDFRMPDEGAFLKSVEERGYWEGQVVQTHRSGRQLDVRCRMTIARHPDGRPAGLITVNDNITERVAAQAQLEHLAYTDATTGLANRPALLRFLHQEAQEPHCGVLFIDLDEFKRVNDLYGHAVGDRVLVRMAGRLRRAAPDAFIARYSGDEFVLVTRDAGALLVLAGHVLSALERPVRVQGAPEVRLTASVGVAWSDAHVEPEELLRRADVAMYSGKAAGKHRVAVYDERSDEARHDRARLADELRAGLARGEVTVAWQPRVRLADGRVMAVEALARWRHPERGTVSPGVFIPVAEESGVIHPLGQAVLRQACRQGQRWAAAGTPVTVAVNVSAMELAREHFLQDVQDALRAEGLAPDLLEIEVTESAAMRDVRANAERLRALRDLGVSVAIDDFGTGYSSLSYLRQLPASVVKVDQSFVRDLTEDLTATEASIVRAVVTLAHGVGMRVVAEGVETETQRRALIALGCQEAQGYLFARPQDAASVGDLLQ